MSTPATSLSVDWEGITDHRVFEQLVSTALCIEHPDARHNDGSGGDGGQDVHFPGPLGLEIYELKNFHGRLGPAQRKQIKRSFDRAMALEPATWTLVLPIDLTPPEEAWFEELTADSSAQCTWWGRTQLDGLLARHWSVARWYLDDVNAEIRRLAELFHAEKAALSNGVPDALDRLRALATQCDALNPFFRIDIAYDSATGTASASLAPRFPGAEEQQPITIQTTLVFPDLATAESVQEQLTATYEFGVRTELPAALVGEVIIDAPGGLGGTWSSTDLAIGPSRLADGPELSFSLLIVDDAAAQVAALALSGGATTMGARGGTAHLTDRTGSVVADVRVDGLERSMTINLSFDLDESLPPATLLPIIRLLAGLRRPNLMVLTLTDGTPVAAPLALQSTEAAIDQAWIRTVELLARLQAATNTSFPMPEVLSSGDIEDMIAADELLSGRIVRGTWQEWRAHVHPGDVSTLLVDQESSPVWKVSEESLSLGDHEMALGRVTTLMRSARPADRERLLRVVDDAGEDTDVEVVFVPAGEPGVERWLGEPGDRPPDVASMPPVGDRPGITAGLAEAVAQAINRSHTGRKAIGSESSTSDPHRPQRFTTSSWLSDTIRSGVWAQAVRDVVANDPDASDQAS